MYNTSIPVEMCALMELSGCKAFDLSHLIVGSKVAGPTGTTVTSLLTYAIPPNRTLILTYAALRSIPPVNDAGLTAGDWRSFDYDASGTAKMWFTVNQNSSTIASSAAVTTVIATYFAVVNRPCLFAFKGGVNLDLVVQRGAGAVPTNEVILVALNCYLAPPTAYDCLSANLTQIEATFT
jgi:hypothetical protein